jgi:hypothetical protein
MWFQSNRGHLSIPLSLNPASYAIYFTYRRTKQAVKLIQTKPLKMRAGFEYVKYAYVPLVGESWNLLAEEIRGFVEIFRESC